MNAQKEIQGEKTVRAVVIGIPQSGKQAVFDNLIRFGEEEDRESQAGKARMQAACRFQGRDIRLLNLPDSFSLSGRFRNGQSVRDTLLNEKPDAALCVAGGDQMKQGLYLAVQAAELGVPVLMVLHRRDRDSRVRVDAERLHWRMGHLVIQDDKGGPEQAETLFSLLCRTADHGGVHERVIDYGADIEPMIQSLEAMIQQSVPRYRGPARWLALKMLENEQDVRKDLERDPAMAPVLEKADEFRRDWNGLKDISLAVAERRQSQALKLWEDTVEPDRTEEGQKGNSRKKSGSAVLWLFVVLAVLVFLIHQIWGAVGYRSFFDALIPFLRG